MAAEDITELVKRVMEFCGYKTFTVLAGKLGMSPQNFGSQKKSGGLKDSLILHAVERGANPEWLRTGQGEIKVAGADCAVNDLLSHTVKMQDIRLAALQDTVNKLQAALQKLTDDTGHEIGEIKNRMIDTASSGDYHRLDPTRPFRN
jgi:hypothetical protein